MKGRSSDTGALAASAESACGRFLFGRSRSCQPSRRRQNLQPPWNPPTEEKFFQRLVLGRGLRRLAHLPEGFLTHGAHDGPVDPREGGLDLGEWEEPA